MTMDSRAGNVKPKRSYDASQRRAQARRNHTRIVFLGDHWMLQDLGATNGSLVNGKQVQSCRLADGDVIKLGDAELRFTLG